MNFEESVNQVYIFRYWKIRLDRKIGFQTVTDKEFYRHLVIKKSFKKLLKKTIFKIRKKKGLPKHSI